MREDEHTIMYRQMPEELKQKALSMLETRDIDTVSATLRIRKTILKRLIEEEAVPAVDATPLASAAAKTVLNAAPTDDVVPGAGEKAPRYSPKFKATALAMMEEKGAVATIKELGISSYTLYDWKNKAAGGGQYPRQQGPLTGKTRKRYPPEFKAEVIEYYQAHGAGETKQKYGISSNAIYTWLEEAGIERNRKSPVDHTDAIALYREKGAESVLETYGITWLTLRIWLKDAGINTHTPKYSPEFVERALVMAQGNTLTAVAKELSIPTTTLSAWKLGKRRKGSGHMS